MGHNAFKEDGKSAKELARNIKEWQHGQSHFTARLFTLISGADVRNLERIRTGFPNEVAAYEAWQRHGEAFLNDPENYI